jgi:hypothetical protein
MTDVLFSVVDFSLCTVLPAPSGIFLSLTFIDPTLDQHENNEHTLKLAKYFARIGFKLIDSGGHMFLDRLMIEPSLLLRKDVLKSFKWKPVFIDPVKTEADMKLIAILESNPNRVKITKAIAEGADLNRARALHICIAIDCGANILALLIELGADINLKDKNRNTPVHVAAGMSKVVYCIFL